MTHPTNYPDYHSLAAAAVRAYRRLMTCKMGDAHLIEEADALFDGGEWSRPYHARQQDDIEQNCLKTVAEAFNISASWLSLKAQDFDFRESMGGR